MTTTPFVLQPGRLGLRDLFELAAGERTIAIDEEARAPIERSSAIVRAVISSGRTAYGVNTGFGALAKTHIPDAQLAELQRRLVLSHAAGTGPILPDEISRMILVLKANALGRGFSGIRREVIDALLRLANAGIYPRIPAKGSVGASGDLAPLAHMTATLLGVGEVSHKGRVLPAAEGLRLAGLEPITLMAKEGLALLNGTQVSTALAAAGLLAAERVFHAGLVAGAMSTDAALGSDAPFDPRIHQIRGQQGQIEVAAQLKALMEGSPLRASHIDCDRVQDPYSLRCQPQVMGAVLDMMRFAATTIQREANAVSDNPLVFADNGDIISGGNFHAEPVAMAADCLAIAIAEIGALSERRTAMLTDARMSNLPAFLVPDPGLNSGFMIAHVTAAALAAENKMLCHPASIDSLPTSANQEDHVSMATHGARRLLDMADNSAAIVAIELLCAAQGVDLRRPVETSPQLKQAHRAIRAGAPFWDQDRLMAPDIAHAKSVIQSGVLSALAPISVF
jgi:histidine ammonia-lyase